MARVAFTFTLLSLLFAFTYARTPFGIPENEVIDTENSVAESDAKPTLFLPSQKTKSETNIEETEAEAVEPKPIDVENDSVGITEDLKTETETQTLDLKRPLTIVKFRPVNRHIGRGCHHGIKKKMMNPWIQRREKSYGDDMILGVQRKEFDPETFRGDGMSQIPAQWMKFHHHHDHKRMPLFPFRHHDHNRFAKHSFRKPFLRDESEDREDERREERGEESGFLNRFSKFFDLF